MKLYWVITEQHEEDWFIIAETATEAAKIHEDYEGYDPGEAIAEHILNIPDEISAEKGWPPNKLLKALGAKFINDGPARSVEISGRIFCEGLMDETILTITDEVFERQGYGRLNKTPKIVVN